MIVDFHTHIFPSRVRENRERYIQMDACFAELYSSPKASMATADDLVSSMDREGVDTSVVLNYGWATHELCAEVNDYILESVSRYPKRLVGFCAIPLGTPPQSAEVTVSEIERCVRGGAKGVGELRPDMLVPRGSEPEAVRPIIDVIREHGLILLVHASEPVGHTYPGKGEATPDILYSLITRFPDARLVCAHWGGGLPFYALMPEVKDAMSNTYFDTAASPFLYSPRVYRQAAELVGADKILFGSDYPLLAQGRLRRQIESAGLSPDAKELVLSGNACRLLGLAPE